MSNAPPDYPLENEWEHATVLVHKNISTFLIAAALSAVCVGSTLMSAYLYHVHDPGFMQIWTELGLSSESEENFAYYWTDPAYFESLDWTSDPQQDDRTRANEDGSLSEWAPHWYIAHRSSGYGEVMARLEPGQVVTVDGHSVMIRGKFMVDFPSKVSDVVSVTGEDYELILLTCVNDGPTPEETRHLWVLWG